MSKYNYKEKRYDASGNSFHRDSIQNANREFRQGLGDICPPRIPNIGSYSTTQYKRNQMRYSSSKRRNIFAPAFS